MDLRSIFINKFGRLRSGYRFVLYVFAFLAASLLFVTALRVVFVVGREFGPSIPHAGYYADLAFRFTSLLAALAAGYLCARILEGLPWRSLGLTLHHRWLPDLLIGVAIGTFALAIAVGIATAAGGLRFSFVGSEMIGATISSLIASGMLFFWAALAEEAAFRGYGLQTLTRAGYVVLGLLLTSLPFALVHLNNPNVIPFVTFANTALAGIWLGVAYLKTRSLWFPLGVHWGWNWALNWLFGLPVSGLNIASHPLIKGEDAGPAWLTGGSYGIEGGIACTVALIVSTLFIWHTRLVSATPDLKKLTSEENPATPRTVVSVLPNNNRA